ncbi:MAG: hypothetical protein JW844_01255 [Candidatus Omnitrophica bacterium]|nr:hypothetical protein [Candidatus Omnitrophota bacterium]
MMSPLHITVNILIGIIVGFFADLFSLQRVPLGVIAFMLVGVAGSFAGEFIVRLLIEHGKLLPLFYSKHFIVIENALSACIFVYLFNLIKWDYR